ncbi:hypothetical protein V8E36_006867 [Tilletia maclaganii]
MLTSCGPLFYLLSKSHRLSLHREVHGHYRVTDLGSSHGQSSPQKSIALPFYMRIHSRKLFLSADLLQPSSILSSALFCNEPPSDTLPIPSISHAEGGPAAETSKARRLIIMLKHTGPASSSSILAFARVLVKSQDATFHSRTGGRAAMTAFPGPSHPPPAGSPSLSSTSNSSNAVNASFNLIRCTEALDVALNTPTALSRSIISSTCNSSPTTTSNSPFLLT